MEHLGNGCPVLGVEVGVYFVEEVEGGGVAALDGEDEGQSAETCGFWLVFVLRDGASYSFDHRLVVGCVVGRRVWS